MISKNKKLFLKIYIHNELFLCKKQYIKYIKEKI